MAVKPRKELRQEKRRFWKAHIQAWEKSGFSQNEYCRRNTLKNSQLTYWKTKFKQERSRQIHFAPVPVEATGKTQRSIDSSDSGLAVQLGRVRIKIQNNFNHDSFVKVVSILEERL